VWFPVWDRAVTQVNGIAVWAEGIKAELAQRLPRQRKTQRDKLAVLVATMLHVRSANLVEVAAGLPRASDRWDMGYQWISRFLANGLVCCDDVMAPFAREILAWLAETGEPIPLILDQTKASDHHQILMLSVRWGERALPLAWRVAETEGAIGFATQQELLEVVAGWLSVGQAVILLADRFYGTPEMICWCCDHGWDYRLRLKGNLVARLGTTRTTTGALALSGGHYFENIVLTGKRITTNLGIIRDPGHTEPWIIAMSAKPGYLTTLGYAARWGIEPMFSDFKSRGFGLQQTHLRYPDRLARLILVMALALYWAVSTGMWDQANNPAPAEKNTRTASRPSSPVEDCPGSPVVSGAPLSFSSNASHSQSSGDV
jgi:DDE family transposase